MATYYIIRKIHGETVTYHHLDYTDPSLKQPKSFTSGREAYKYAMERFGTDQFELVKIIEAMDQFELKE